MQRNLIIAHPEFLAAWSVWEPNTFDQRDTKYRNTAGTDKTGRYMPYWHHTDSGGVGLDAIVGLDDPTSNSWYELPKNSHQETVLEPYSYEVNGKQLLMTSAEMPIMRNGVF